MSGVLFAGQYFDNETGLHYNWNRYYSPETGRYIASDPLGLVAGLNVYNYVNGNPLWAIDPLGLESCSWGEIPGGCDYDFAESGEPQAESLKEYIFDLNSRQESNLRNEDVQYKAFSGEGKHRNNPNSVSVPYKGPIPPGRYYIVDRPTGGRLGWLKDYFSGKDKWFALYRDDGAIDDETIVCVYDENDKVTKCELRDNFRLHPGSTSWGCVTLINDEDYDSLRDSLRNTKPENIPGTDIPHYGTIDVK
mgnify:CR=1 FL=1